jgi:chromosomal replication initiation ATPase DnaA
MMSYFVMPGIPKDNSTLPEKLFKVIQKEFGVTQEQIASKSRKRAIVVYRQLFCYFVMEHRILSLKAVGDLIGNRDHTTVIHSVNTIKDLIDVEDPDILKPYNIIKNLIP